MESAGDRNKESSAVHATVLAHVSKRDKYMSYGQNLDMTKGHPKVGWAPIGFAVAAPCTNLPEGIVWVSF